MRHRIFKRKPANSQDMALQITSMADILVIIVVFLLKSYAAGLSNVTPESKMLLPEAKGTAQMKDALKIEVSQDSVLIDRQATIGLANFQFDAHDLTASGTSQSIVAALSHERDTQKMNGNDSTLLLMADENTPYSTLKTIMASASEAGFVDLQLVVAEVN